MSAEPAHDTGWRRAALAAALAALLFCAYLLTFSGVPVSDDERHIIDTTDSMAVRGNLLLNQTSYLQPIQVTLVEPGQPLLSVPLYWLAYHTPWVGNVHALYLFSPIVTALTGVLLFFFALEHGYRERTALAAALLFGLTTIAWPYTKTYFREPLTTLNLFAAAYLLARWRRQFQAGERRHWLALAGGVLLAVLALLSKEAMLIALPALVLIAYPGRAALARYRRQMVIIGMGLVAVAAVFALTMLVFRTQFLAWVTRYDIPRRLATFAAGLPGAWRGVAGYLVSPGKAVWWYSPVLLLALGAPVVLPRSRWRESWLPLGLLLAFVVGYAGVRGPEWSGGTGWGARYMVPLVPFLMVAALPLIDRMLDAARLGPRLALAALALWGLAIQLGGTYVSLPDYYRYLEASLDQPPWQGPAIWSFRWSQAFGSLLYLPRAVTDIRWLLPEVDWAALAAIALALALVVGALVWLRRREQIGRRAALGIALGAPLLAAVSAVFVLVLAYDDPRYDGGNTAAQDMRAAVQAQAAPGDTIILSSPTYVPLFMNYYKGEAAWYSLPWAPGERYSPEDTPELSEGTVEALAGGDAAYMNRQFTQGGTYYNGEPVWLVMDLGPDLPWAPRPVENLFTEHNYPAAMQDFSQYARVVQYLPYQAPPPGQRPRHVRGVRFGEAMRLLGYDMTVNGELGRPDTLAPGDYVGLSLLWVADAPVGADYTVSVHIIGPDGVSMLQQDRAPAGGFAPTSTWAPGEPVRDNYGFILPGDAPAGAYDVWVIVYSWPSLERLAVTGPDDRSIGDFLSLGEAAVP